MVGADEDKRKELLKRVMAFLAEARNDVPPPYLSRDVYNIISEILGVEDPYKEKKEESNSMALSLYPQLKKMVEEADDPLFEAVRIAIIGNIIDFGACQEFKLEDISSFHEIPIGINHYPQLKEEIERAKTVLYIGDNAGEVVFDRILLEKLKEMGKRLYFAVRSAPIINDVTKKEAIEAGIDKVAEIIESGSDAPGIVIEKATERFKHLFRDAHVVISKGQGNYETLEDIPRRVYFLLRVKCPVVARKIGTEMGNIVILKGGRECRGLLL